MNLTTRVTALETDVTEIKADVKAILAALRGDQPAVTAPKAPKADQPKADGKVYRSAKGKEAAKIEVAALWSDAKIMADVKRVRDLTPAQRAAVDAQVKAVWAAVPKTRTTKA